MLGACIISDEALAEVIDILKPNDFYARKHALIWQALVALFERGAPVDMITVTSHLRDMERLSQVGGAYYITELTGRVDTTTNVEYYARVLQQKAVKRGLIGVATAILKEGYDSSIDAFAALENADRQIYEVGQHIGRKSSQPLKELLSKTIAHMEARGSSAGSATGVPTGYAQLDDLTAGWQPSDLIIIAARPSMGKSAFATSLARNAALAPAGAVPVALFTLEMSAQQNTERLICAEARVDLQRARTGNIEPEAWPRIARAAGRLSQAPIYIDDTSSLSVLELRAKCRRLKAKREIGLIIVDYLQLMTAGAQAHGNREQEIAHISRSLKGIARELSVPVIALAQLSRAVETRGGDKRPQLSDLRESGAIENDADVVAFIYRAERYGITVDEDGNGTEGIGEIIIGKQRMGPLGTVRLAFVKEYARFENLTTQYRQQELPETPFRSIAPTRSGPLTETDSPF